MALRAGETAPDFTLPSGGLEETVSLSDFSGESVVLLFFPMAFTPTCTEEMCTISDNLEEYERLDARVLGISVDSPFAQNAWKEQEDIEIPLLSDFNREVVAEYGVKRDDLMGLRDVSNRAVFVINDSGEIVYSWESDDPGVLPDFDAIQSALKGDA